MTKLEVYQWQFDEIESCVWRTPGGPAWVEESLTLIQNENIFRLYEVVYVFFGPLANLLTWKRQMEGKLGEYDRVVHATQWNKIEGLRAMTKRVYDLDNDKTWYHTNYHDPEIRRTLEAMYQLESRYGRVE
jgi:hypothetical protein